MRGPCWRMRVALQLQRSRRHTERGAITVINGSGVSKAGVSPGVTDAEKMVILLVYAGT